MRSNKEGGEHKSINYHKKMIPEGTSLDTLIHQQKTSLMDLAIFTMHTFTEKGFPTI
jgi:hypothetical protein